MMAKKVINPIHPGEILMEEFLEPLGISQYRLAKDISVPPRRINEIVHGKRSITADTALRLARFFGTTERFWLNLQVRYDLEVEKDRLADVLERDVSVFQAVVYLDSRPHPSPTRGQPADGSGCDRWPGFAGQRSPAHGGGSRRPQGRQ